MGRVIVGTKSLKNRGQVQRAVGGPRRIRCPQCQGLAVPALDTATGKEVLRCSGCGRQFTSQAM